MIDRRTFTTLLAGSVAAPNMSWGQSAKGKTVYFASVGGELTLYSMDVDGAALTKVNTTTLPANIQYARRRSKRCRRIASRGAGPASPATRTSRTPSASIRALAR